MMPYEWIVQSLDHMGMEREAKAVRQLIAERKAALEDAAWQGRRRLEVQAAADQVRADVAALHGASK